MLALLEALKDMSAAVEWVGVPPEGYDGIRQIAMDVLRSLKETCLVAELLYTLTLEPNRFQKRKIALKFTREVKVLGIAVWPAMLEEARKAVNLTQSSPKGASD